MVRILSGISVVSYSPNGQETKHVKIGHVKLTEHTFKCIFVSTGKYFP